MSAAEEALVRAVGRIMMVLPRTIDADMVREAHLPLSEYMALMHLSEAPDRRMRMSELATASLVSLSGMTRIVARLEGEGLVQRVRCDEDARGLHAVLTDAGLARLREAWPTHLASVRRHILDHLGGADPAALTSILERFAT
ncbi:transcriptional regulator, MarR family [Streptomyces sp. DvalAA-14]|uniref:MarR family winged helix-turn-helix transcriptional regulator n=1 Tax=unclassified Streptomyces TaxID=2593676 RepID=UPI00081BB85A|nr:MULTISPECIES: MarR family transcriptional regulator [unclassified Streptomyces]MYS21485.1 MarR family transcriptional regulator [Streptomyces sp. SID4948]SCD93740.1 transcriptional regulator, MarR family [Streptomyces sp. DvalAA-14]